MQFILDFKLYFTSGLQVFNDNKHRLRSPILGLGISCQFKEFYRYANLQLVNGLSILMAH